MRLEVQRDTLATALRSTKDAVGSGLSVMCGVLVEAGEGVTLTTTDARVAMRYSAHADVQEPGAVVVSHRLLSDMVRRLPDRPVRIETAVSEADGVRSVTATVRCGRSKMEMHTIPALDFPPFNAVEGESVTIPEHVVRDVNAMVRPFSANDVTRPVLSAVHLRSSDGTLRAEAAGNYRMASYEVEADCGDIDVLVPARDFDRVVRASSGDVTLTCLGSRLSLTSGSLVTTTSQISGSFPRMELVWGDERVTRVTVSAEEMADALGRALVCAGDAMAVRLAVSGGEVTLSSSDKGGGTARESMSAEVDGPENGIALNCRYAHEVMSAMSGDVTMSINDASSPAQFECWGEGFTYRHLLLPVRF